MKRSDIPEARELIRDVADATFAILAEKAQAERLNSLAAKVDAIASWVEAKKADARRPVKSTKLARTLVAMCLMNQTASEREADKLAAWAEQARKTDSSEAVMNTMFMR